MLDVLDVLDVLELLEEVEPVAMASAAVSAVATSDVVQPLAGQVVVLAVTPPPAELPMKVVFPFFDPAATAKLVC
ncbi:MAG: hypothetical protein JSR42_10060 [Proteobacteria bacterium]|nr:hypothetical protein [Pseudomonadota bacterium]